MIQRVATAVILIPLVLLLVLKAPLYVLALVAGAVALLAIVEFLNDGLERLADRNEPVLLLFEDADFRTIHFICKPDNVHLLSTVAMLRGLEECGVIPSADAIVDAMVNPPDPARRRQARRFADLPRGTDDQAGSGSRWKP